LIKGYLFIGLLVAKCNEFIGIKNRAILNLSHELYSLLG